MMKTKIPMSNFETLFLSFTDILYSQSRVQQYCFDFALNFVFFQLGIFYFSDLDGVAEFGMILPAILYSFLFSSLSMGLGLYDRSGRFYSLIRLAFKVIIAGMLSSLVLLSVLALTWLPDAVYFVVYIGSATACSILLIFNLVRAVGYKMIEYKFTVIGDSPMIQEIKQFFSDSSKQDAQHLKYFEWNLDDLTNYNFIIENKIRDIVISRKVLDSKEGADLALWAIKHRLMVIEESKFYATIFEKVHLKCLTKSWVFENGLSHRNYGSRFLVRIMDIVHRNPGHPDFFAYYDDTGNLYQAY